MAADRMAGDRKGPYQILAVESARVDQSAQTGCNRQTTLAHRARLRRTQAGTRAGTLRRPELARLSSPCHPGHRSLRIPGAGAVPISPLRQLLHAPNWGHPASLTQLAASILAPRRFR